MTVDSFYFAERYKPDDEVEYIFEHESIGAGTIEVWTVDVDNVWTLLDPGLYTVEVGSRASIYARGKVTLNDPFVPVNGEELSIERTTPITQTISFTPFDSFPSEQFEYASDKITLILQELDGEKCDCRGECIQVTITGQPQDVTAGEGQVATFTVVAEGTDPISYQWLEDGVEMAGETNATLTFVVDAVNKTKTYSVRVTNACGQVVSNEVNVIGACIQWGLSQTQVIGTEIWRSSDLYNDSSKDIAVQTLIGRDGLMATIGNQIWQVEAQVGDAYSKNRLWYSSNFGADWALVDRPFDDWTASWWSGSDYAGLMNNGAWINLRKRTGGGLWANYFIDSNRRFTVATVSGTSNNVWYSSWANSSRREYTAAYAKIETHCYYIEPEGGGIRMGGKTIDAGAFNVVLNLAGREDGQDPDNDGFIPEEPPSGSGTPRLLNDNTLVTPEANNCFNIKEVGGWTFMGADSDKIWVYDPNPAAVGTQIRELVQTQWNGVSFWFGTYQYEWLYENQPPNELWNAILDTSDRNLWGWVKFNGYVADQPELIVPYGGVATGGNPNAGKFRYYRITGQTPGSSLSEGDYEYLSLLTPQVGSETSLEICRLWYIEQLNVFALVYAFNQNATFDGWPQRFYLRISSDPNPLNFSDPLRVDHPPTAFGGNQLSARGNGGYSIDYSTAQNKWVVSSRHLTGTSVWHQILWTFDDVFFCEVFG